MSDDFANRLILVAGLFVVALVGPSALWLAGDLQPARLGVAVTKLALVSGVASMVALVLWLRTIRRRRAALEAVEKFVSALPVAEVGLPENDASELAAVTRALRAMAYRIRGVMDRARTELSRRETILACMAEGVLAVDSDLRVIFCNEAFAKAFNIRRPASEGRILYEVVREPMIRDILERVLRSETPETDRYQLPSAAGKWFEARTLPFGEQPEHGAVLVLHDVTDIERQEQVRKDFVADVSHELRTPLAAIRGYAETLLDGALEDQENNRKFLEIIRSHAIRLNNIASDLLVISELDSQAPPPIPPERLSLLGIIESALHTVEGHASLRNVELDTSGCRECSVIGYRFRLEQALTNLLDNAVKFNKPEGRVVVECEPVPDRRVRISVADTGIGIPSDELRRIFERFYRVDKARTRAAGGTGLGLPIVKEVVEAMGGTVSVESQLGRGSKFTILLKAS
jgi:two-component system phosphate regulon sensor histidine kinase PhoR